MSHGPPVPVGRLSALEVVCQRIGGRIGWIFLRRHADQDVTDGVIVPRNAQALKCALAPRVDVRCDRRPLLPCGLIVDRHSGAAGRGDGHGRQRVVMAGDAARLLQKTDVGPLQERNRPQQGGTHRAGRPMSGQSPRFAIAE
jgi:hypothetical protein